MSKKLTEKASLIKRVNEIEVQEQKELEDKHFNTLNNKYLGKFFRTRNTYGGKDKGWWLYFKVIKIKKEDIYELHDERPSANCKVLKFETTTQGNILISEANSYLHSLGTEITEAQYNDAWNAVMDKINSF